MKLTLTATEFVTTLDGVPCRVWNGVTEAGIPIKVFVHRIAVANGENHEAFERELIEQLPPGLSVDLRLIL